MTAKTAPMRDHDLMGTAQLVTTVMVDAVNALLGRQGEVRALAAQR